MLFVTFYYLSELEITYNIKPLYFIHPKVSPRQESAENAIAYCIDIQIHIDLFKNVKYLNCLLLSDIDRCCISLMVDTNEIEIASLWAWRWP